MESVASKPLRKESIKQKEMVYFYSVRYAYLSTPLTFFFLLIHAKGNHEHQTPRGNEANRKQVNNI